MKNVLNLLIALIATPAISCLIAIIYFWDYSNSLENDIIVNSIEIKKNLKTIESSQDIEELRNISINFMNYLEWDIKSNQEDVESYINILTPLTVILFINLGIAIFVRKEMVSNKRVQNDGMPSAPASDS